MPRSSFLFVDALLLHLYLLSWFVLQSPSRFGCFPCCAIFRSLSFTSPSRLHPSVVFTTPFHTRVRIHEVAYYFLRARARPLTYTTICPICRLQPWLLSISNAESKSDISAGSVMSSSADPVFPSLTFAIPVSLRSSMFAGSMASIPYFSTDTFAIGASDSQYTYEYTMGKIAVLHDFRRRV